MVLQLQATAQDQRQLTESLAAGHTISVSWVFNPYQCATHAIAERALNNRLTLLCHGPVLQGALRKRPCETSLCKFRDVPCGSSVWKNTEGQTEVLSYLTTISEGPAWQKDGLGPGSFLTIL